MVIQSEQLLETLLDLERSRQRERESRIEAEALLDGLRGMSGAQEQQDLFQALLLALRNVIDFEQSFILQARNEQEMTVLATTLPAIQDSRWEIGPVFTKTLAGKPVASFDVSQVPEWKQQPAEVVANIRSALHIGLQGSAWKTILVITHSQSKHFGPSHVKKAMRFSPLAAQALLTLELRKALLERDRFYQLSLDAMAIFTADGSIIQNNQGWRDRFDGDASRVCKVFDMVHPEESEQFHHVIRSLGHQEGNQLIKTRLQDTSGEYHWFSCSIALYPDQMIYYVVARDITKSVLFEQKLAYQAGHDSLTGLKNRAEFMESLKAAFGKYQQNTDNRFALLFLDLNKFKAINDTFGHDIGDELLKAFARTLKGSVRSEDIVSRLGGDEFTIILNRAHAVGEVETVARRIRENCRLPFRLKGYSVQASTSIGIAISTTYFNHAEDMIHAADLAMYSAKQDKTLPFFIHQGPLRCDFVVGA